MCTVWYFSLCLCQRVHSREPNSRVIEASLHTIYLPTMANFTFSFPPCLHMWQFAFRMEACKSLIWSNFLWFCSQLQHLEEADCSWNCHYILPLQKLPFRVISEKFNEWHYSAYPIYVFKQSSSVSGNRLPLWLVWLWGEIYGLVKLLNEQINRFVFDIVCCIQKHLHAPLFYVHFWDRQFFIVILRDVTFAAHPEQKVFVAFAHAWKNFEAADFDINGHSSTYLQSYIVNQAQLTSANASVQE